jgi:hypothetical protein
VGFKTAGQLPSLAGRFTPAFYPWLWGGTRRHSEVEARLRMGEWKDALGERRRLLYEVLVSGRAAAGRAASGVALLLDASEPAAAAAAAANVWL